MRSILLISILSPFFVFSQVSKDYAILLSAEVKVNPPEITLSWPAETASSYLVYKKLKSDVNFGSSFAILPSSATSYTDTAVVVGESYEYYVRRNSSPPGLGYINSGIKADADDNNIAVKGKLILLVDSSQALSLKAEIDRLIDDLEGEGWTVLRTDVSPNETVLNVKQIIIDEYNSDPANMKSLFLLGHIPVPYSGNLAPDGHSNHVGAWPSDAFYGDIDGIWTDNVVNNSVASDPRNKNIPGDGKFDYSILPSKVELQVGRVDLSDMPAFSNSETELLRQYLEKNHAYRVKKIQTEYRGLIDDNFGGFSGEAFAASAWKAFPTFFGPDSITFANNSTTADYRTNLNKQSYLWSYGCGGGSYTSAGGIGNTAQLAGDSLQTVFTLLFGSYFGDWDKTNNFLRAPLAQGLTLTNAWSGRPHWYFHHMAMGETIGYSQWLMVNNKNTYFQHYGKRFVHIALMGDPTLRMYTIAPPSNLQLSEVGNRVNLTWDVSPENVLGYHVFRKDSLKGIYHRINQDIINGTAYTDSFFDSNGNFYYSVRAEKLEVSKSGSFYNLSGGAIGKIQTIYTSINEPILNNEFILIPNPARDRFTLRYSGFLAGEYEIVIENRLGQTIKREKIRCENSGKFEVHISDIPSGMYIVSLRNINVIVSKKLIINH